MKKISVIVPVYNVRPYLEKCVSSLLAQSMSDFEVFLIDDGSDDGSLALCEKLSSSDARISVIKSEHGGPSKARNLGLDAATGEFIAFVDSDDSLPSDAFQNYLDGILDADILVTQYVFLYENHTKPDRYNKIYPYSTCSPEVLLTELYLQTDLGSQHFLWNKLYRRSLIEDNHIRFDEDIVYNEDRLFTARYLHYCRSVNLTNQLTYFHLIRDSGLVRQKEQGVFRRDSLTDLEAIERAKEVIRQDYPRAYNAACRSAFYCALKLYGEAPETEYEIRHMLRDAQTKNLFYYLFHSGKLSPIKEKRRMLRFWLARRHL